jgi:hypothetical protein
MQPLVLVVVVVVLVQEFLTMTGVQNNIAINS